MCYLHLLDKEFIKKFNARFKEKDDFFGMTEIENILTSNYQELVSRFDIKVLCNFIRLKHGESININTFMSEYERAVNLISYKLY